MILLPDPTVQFSFCSPAHIPTGNKGSPRFNAGCVLQTSPLKAGPDLHCEALPTDQKVLSRLHDGGMVVLFYPGISAPGFHSYTSSTVSTACALCAISLSQALLSHLQICNIFSLLSFSVLVNTEQKRVHTSPWPLAQFLPPSPGCEAEQPGMKVVVAA